MCILITTSYEINNETICIALMRNLCRIFPCECDERLFASFFSRLSVSVTHTNNTHVDEFQGEVVQITGTPTYSQQLKG